MSRRLLIRRARARLNGERGFTILETVIALMVVFGSLTALAYTASNGFRYTGYGRDRIQATGIANRIMEDIRGLAYTKITNGIPTSELATDSRAVNCSGTYRFESCAGEKIVSSTFAAGYTAAWLVPHKNTLTIGNLDVTYATYITNNTPTTTPYRVTVIIQWTGGAIGNAPNNSVRLQTLFWSPDGCVNSTTHPFAAPCQPFFYGQVDAPQATLSVTGQLYDFAIDFDRLAVTLPGATATTQEEQTAQLNSTTTLSGITFTDSAGDEEVGDQRATTDADDQAETAAAASAGGATTNLSALTLSRVVTGGSGQQVGLRANVALGDLEGRSASVDASGVDAYACPTTGVRETDLLPCAGAHVRQVGTITVEVLHAQLLAAVGPANLLRIVGPATNTTAWIDRDVGGTNEDGILDVNANRTLGTIQLGGFPSAGMTAPGRDEHDPNERHQLLRPAGRLPGQRAGDRGREHRDRSLRVHRGRNPLLLQRRRVLEQGLDRLRARYPDRDVLQDAAGRGVQRDVAGHRRVRGDQALLDHYGADRRPGEREHPLGRHRLDAPDRDHDPLRVHRGRHHPDQPALDVRPG